jgi:PAS domain S-box-containing protein
MTSPADAREAQPSRPYDLERRVREALLRLAYNDQPISLAAALVYGFAVAWVLQRAANSSASWIWFGALAAVAGLRFQLASAFQRDVQTAQRQRIWSRRFLLGALAMGAAWGAMGWFFYPLVPASYRALVIMVIGGVVAASSRAIAAQASAFAGFAALAVLPITLRLAMSGSSGGAFMAAFMIIFAAFMLAVARSFRETVARSARLGFENADLAANLTRDIAARRSAEEALRASEERLRIAVYALDHAQDLVVIADRAGAVLHVNEAFRRFTGRSLVALQERRAWMTHAALDETKFEALWERLTREGTLTFENEMVAGSGEKKLVEVSVTHVAFDGHEALCAISRDLTGRRAAEEEKGRLQQQLLETQKLESLGVLAGGIAHDFNNLLTPILGNATLARESLTRPLELREMLTQIERAANQAAGLCRQMLAYAGKGQFIVEPVDLSALVSESSKLLEMSVGHRAQLSLRLAQGLPGVMADASQLRQIVMNLVHNAAEAVHERDGQIVVATSRVQINRALMVGARVAADLPDGDGVCLEVSDNGCGMDRATLERIFEPFFTTKFTGRGLGLAAVLGLVRSHRGVLLLHSEPGRGTTFRLVLAAAPAPTRVPSNSPLPGGEHIRAAGRALVVDDEATVRNVARQLLERIGFTVDAVEDGDAALSALATDPERYQLILLDLTMPRSDGVTTLREIRRRGSRTSVVLMSGFSEEQARARLGPLDVIGFLQKPFDLPVLRQKVEPVLTRSGMEVEKT